MLVLISKFKINSGLHIQKQVHLYGFKILPTFIPDEDNIIPITD